MCDVPFDRLQFYHSFLDRLRTHYHLRQNIAVVAIFVRQVPCNVEHLRQGDLLAEQILVIGLQLFFFVDGRALHDHFVQDEADAFRTARRRLRGGGWNDLWRRLGRRRGRSKLTLNLSRRGSGRGLLLCESPKRRDCKGRSELEPARLEREHTGLLVLSLS